ncbi:polyprenyl synthetase family protein [Hamadaea tsunoensis]|uniref:polyprenyl synthetase family protein n=1 Tax=Hamadaea tsunoensis TaxID=53368 RepID=UPI0004072E85|nr:polyprenyl synthetase family protein [Hamadaea tsunoensis]
MMTALEATPTAQVAARALEAARTAVDPALREAVDALPGALRRLAGYHFGWWDRHGVPEAGDPGKALRPALALLAAEAVGGSTNAALPAAVAVELVHNFSLIHDDVMDGDETRRHRPTVWKVFGVGHAILAGDALLALAFEAIATADRPAGDGTRMLAAAVNDLLEGQGEDLAFETRDDVRVEQCLAMARHKTGALLECSAGLGALFGGGTAAQVAQLRAFGADLGLAFQFADDLLGIWGDPAVTGKPVYSDLRSRKKSLPVVAALSGGSPVAGPLRDAYSGEGELSEAELERLAAAIDLAGGRAWCLAQADELLERALDALTMGGPLTGTTPLAAVAALAARRDR